MARHHRLSPRRVAAAAAAGAVLLAGLVLAVSSATASPAKPKTLRLAYLSFAVANPYDTPMLAAAQTAASALNAKITVFDANNSATTQFNQLQNVIAAGKRRYDGVIVQPIFGAGLVTLVRQAIAKGIKVGNVDQILGADFTTSRPQVKGLSANVVHVPSEIGRKLGVLTVRACNRIGKAPCKVGYIYGVKASGVDKAVRTAFDRAIAAGREVQVVAEGESFFSTEGGLTATQNILQAQPDLHVLVGADQALTGGRSAIQAAGRKDLLQVGWGGSQLGLQAVRTGVQFGDVMMRPATAGRLAVQDLVRAIRTGKSQPGRDVLAGLPDDGIVTRANVKKFTPEYYG